MQQAFRRTLSQSEKLTTLMIGRASSQGMSGLIHVDLRKYGEFMEEMLRIHLMTNFNIAHFGFSRRAIDLLLEKYDNC